MISFVFKITLFWEFRSSINISLSLRLRFQKFVSWTCSCHFQHETTTSFLFAISVANCSAYFLSGIMKTLFFAEYHYSWMVFESWFKILSLFSLSGSSSLKMIISAYLTAMSHIIGRLSLSRFHGAPHLALSLQSHFVSFAKLRVFSNQSGVWAKSTKNLVQSIYIGYILHCTHWKSSMDFRMGSISIQRLTQTEIAHRILLIL